MMVYVVCAHSSLTHLVYAEISYLIIKQPWECYEDKEEAYGKAHMVDNWGL